MENLIYLIAICLGFLMRIYKKGRKGKATKVEIISVALGLSLLLAAGNQTFVIGWSGWYSVGQMGWSWLIIFVSQAGADFLARPKKES